jgi:ubiquitin-activating enzyme E1
LISPVNVHQNPLIYIQTHIQVKTPQTLAFKPMISPVNVHQNPLIYIQTHIQVKTPQTLAFKPMAKARDEMLSLPTDFGKASLTHQLTLHACFETLERFRREKGRAPTPGSAKEAKAFGKMVKACALLQSVPKAHHAARKSSTNTKKKKVGGNKGPEVVHVDERVVEAFARTCQGALAPICSVVGGTAAQEVLKACTGTFVPLQQYLFFDAVEALPEELPAEADCRCERARTGWGGCGLIG